MARPRKSQARSEKVQFRATLAELVTLREAADRHGLSLAEYARETATVAANSALKRKPKKPRRPARQASATAIQPQRLDAEAYHLIRMLGVNLNQLAHQANMLMMPTPSELEPLLRQIQQVLSEHVGRRGRR